MIMITGPPVFLLVEFFCFQETGNALDFPEAFRIAGILETTLVTQADVIHHVIEASDDVEGINADLYFGESFLCHGYEAVAHVTAEIFHLSALIGRKLTEVPVKINTGDLVQDVNDCMGIPIGDVAVVFIPVPSVMLRTPDPAVPFEFIYAERFGKAARPSEVDGLKDRLDQIFSDTVASCDFCKSDGFNEIQQDRIVEGLRNTKRGMDPIRRLIERGRTGFTEQPALMKGYCRSAVIVGDMPYSLVCTGILNDAVAGTAMRAEAMLWRGDIKSDEIIIPESLHFPDPGFLGQFG